MHVLCKCSVFAKMYILQIFFRGKQPQNLLCLFFSGKLKFPRAIRLLIVVKKVMGKLLKKLISIPAKTSSYATDWTKILP